MKKKGQYISKKKRQYSGKRVSNQNKNVEKKEVPRKKDNYIPPKKTFSNNTKFIALFVILSITFAVYIPTFQNEVTNWDDQNYVSLKTKDNINGNTMLENLDVETLKKIFYSEDLKERYFMGNYHPLTMLSLNLNYQVTGADEDGETIPWLFQLTNILLHVISTALLFFIILKLFDNLEIAIITALLFGIHTIHVESITWISERKDVLYTAFYLSSLLFYIEYIKKEKIQFIIIAFLFFLLSLLSKAQAVSLAVTFVAVDYFLNRKLLSAKIIIEKIPFVALGMLFGLIAINAQDEGYAIQSGVYGFHKRIAIAGYGFTQYLIKLIIPFNLSAIYPYPDIVDKTIPTYYWLGLIPSFLVGGAGIYFFKKDKKITFAILFFILNILLLLQLIPVGSAMYSDRYAYIPSIGFFIAIAYLSNLITDKKISFLESLSSKIKIGGINITVFHIIIFLYIGLLSYMTIEREHVWKNSLTHWSDVIEKQPKAVVSYNNRGTIYNNTAKEYKENNDYQKFKEYKLLAIDDFSNAIKRKPDYTSAFYNRGSCKKELGAEFSDTALVKEAIKDFDKSIAIDLKFVAAYQERGGAYDFLGEFQKALSDYNTTIQLNPENSEVVINKGVTLGKMGKYKEAIETFDIAININPENASAYSNRGLAKVFAGDDAGAMLDYNKSIELDQTSFKAFHNRAMLLHKNGNIEAAIQDMNKVIEFKKDNAGAAYYTRAIYFLEINKINEACNDLKVATSYNIPGAKEMIEKYCK